MFEEWLQEKVSASEQFDPGYLSVIENIHTKLKLFKCTEEYKEWFVKAVGERPEKIMHHMVYIKRVSRVCSSVIFLFISVNRDNISSEVIRGKCNKLKFFILEQFPSYYQPWFLKIVT